MGKGEGQFTWANKAIFSAKDAEIPSENNLVESNMPPLCMAGFHHVSMTGA
jgi:hypothetical protein